MKKVIGLLNPPKTRPDFVLWIQFLISATASNPAGTVEWVRETRANLTRSIITSLNLSASRMSSFSPNFYQYVVSSDFVMMMLMMMREMILPDKTGRVLASRRI